MARCYADSVLDRKERIRIAEVPFYFKEESTVTIIRALRSIKEDINLQRDIRWKSMYHVIKELNFDNEKKSYSISFLLEVLKLMERYTCRDMYVIFQILRMLYDSNSVVWTSDGYFTEIEKLDHRQFLHYIYNENYNLREDFIWSTITSARVGLLKLMLKFGLKKLYPDTRRISCGADPIFFQEIRIARRANVQLYTLRKNRHNCDYLRRFRLKALSFHIVTMMHNLPERLSDYAMCYKLFFESIGEPYISIREFRHFVQKCSSGFNDPIQSVEMFKLLLPEVPDVPEPRSLQHLCRIEIRESLCQNFNLPYGVSSLNLPNYLKKYILLKDDGDYNISFLSDKTETWMSVRDIPHHDDSVLACLKDL